MLLSNEEQQRIRHCENLKNGSIDADLLEETSEVLKTGVSGVRILRTNMSCSVCRSYGAGE